MIKEYILWNWGLLLTLAAFIISLKQTIFLDKTTVRRLYILILVIFLLSIVVYAEFYLANLGRSADIRTVLMAIRYSATPFIVAMIIYTLAKKVRWFIFIPAIILTVIDFISIFTGIVFSIDDDSTLIRGPLGYLPYIMVGAYCALLIYILIKRSNKQTMEIIPTVFLGLAFLSGLILPFIYGSDYSKIFCTTIAIALYVYYVFLNLQLTKKDSLTGLLNRQAYYAEIDNESQGITAMISMDMNGLKDINDNNGHAAGDEALTTLASCFMRALRKRQLCYRIGGDEFVIICRQTSESDMLKLVERLKNNVAETKYSCSIGYSHIADGAGSIDEMLRKSDEMLYEEKASFYKKIGKDRRKR